MFNTNAEAASKQSDAAYVRYDGSKIGGNSAVQSGYGGGAAASGGSYGYQQVRVN